jgi:hypothetical protein
MRKNIIVIEKLEAEHTISKALPFSEEWIKCKNVSRRPKTTLQTVNISTTSGVDAMLNFVALHDSKNLIYISEIDLPTKYIHRIESCKSAAGNGTAFNRGNPSFPQPRKPITDDNQPSI